MFDSFYKPEYPRQKGDYSLRCPVDNSWADASHKILIVIETIDPQDLKHSALLFDRSNRVVSNLLTYSIKQAKAQGLKRRDVAFATVNFNNHKFMDTPKQRWPAFRGEFAKRVRATIEDLKPNVVLVFGDYASKYLLPDVEYLEKKRGWVIPARFGSHKTKVIPSLDLLPLYTVSKDAQEDIDSSEEEDAGDVDIYAKSNLMLYVSGHVVNALLGKMLYDLSDVKVKPILIKTIEGFDKLYKRIKTAEYLGVDTETENLSVNHNKIKTIQFAFPECLEDMKGYMLPLYHEETPFSPKELRYIHKRLRKFFYARPGTYPCKYLIATNGKFDNRIIRKQLDIPIIFHPFWELTAGEWLLDENRTALKDKPIGTPHGGLEQIFFTYGNDHYKSAGFSKEDRSNASKTKISNPEFVEYGCMDCVSLVHMHQMQLRRAGDLKLGDKSYRPYFKRLVLTQMSNTVHAISHMETKGMNMDKDYLLNLISEKSPMIKLIKDFTSRLLGHKEVKEANAKVLDKGSGQTGNKGLFGTVLNVFNFGKADHKKTLFFDVMGLAPVGKTKTGEPAVNKAFIKFYERQHEVVSEYGKLTKLKKLWSTYVKGWVKKIKASPDSRVDWRLRAMYGFFDVVTGRLNGMKPSFQQVPTRGAEAKYVKRSFRAPKGHLHVKFDYSAHEVRVWSYVAFDLVLASVFKVGQELRQKLRRTTDPEKIATIFAELKKKGDVHIQNVKRFFDIWVDKNHQLRDAIKSVVFGVIYQKSAKSLAKDIRANVKNNLDDKKYALIKERKDNKDKARAKQIEIEQAQLDKDYKELKKDDKVELSKGIMSKMFKEFPKGAEWLEWSKNHAAENYYTYSPIGVRRNLFGIMTGINGIVAAMLRRAANSPVQGLASQIGVTASRLVAIEMWKVLMKFGYMDEDTAEMPVEILKQVHDAQYSEVPYEILLIFIHVLQYTTTYGVRKYFKETFDFDFTIEPEIELEVGATEDAHYKWDWTDSSLKDIINKALDDQVKLGDLDAKERNKAEKLIWKVYDNTKLKKHLHTHYPILGVIPKKYLEKEEVT